jgi:hypothetical protein
MFLVARQILNMCSVATFPASASADAAASSDARRLETPPPPTPTRSRSRSRSTTTDGDVVVHVGREVECELLVGEHEFLYVLRRGSDLDVSFGMAYMLPCLLKHGETSENRNFNFQTVGLQKPCTDRQVCRSSTSSDVCFVANNIFIY